MYIKLHFATLRPSDFIASDFSLKTLQWPSHHNPSKLVGMVEAKKAKEVNAKSASVESETHLLVAFWEAPLGGGGSNHLPGWFWALIKRRIVPAQMGIFLFLGGSEPGW